MFCFRVTPLVKELSKEVVRTGTLLVVIFGFVFVAHAAFQEPTVAPTGGTVWAPINTSGNAQTKTGSFTSSATITGNTLNATGSLCVGATPCASTVVSSINGVGGAFTFTGTGVSQLGNTFTFSGGGGGGSLGGSGTTNYISKWTGATTLGNSLVYDSGAGVGIGTTNPGAKLDVENGNIFNMTAGGGNGFWVGIEPVTRRGILDFNISNFLSLQSGQWGGTTYPLVLQGGGGSVAIGTTAVPAGSGSLAATGNVYSQVAGGKVIGIGELQKAKIDYPSQLIYGAGYDSASGFPGVMIPANSTLWITAQSGVAHLSVTGSLAVNGADDTSSFQKIKLGGYGLIVIPSCPGCWSSQANGGDVVIRAQGAGNQVILTAGGGASAYLKIAPNNQVYASGAFNNLSDARLKTDVVEISDALEKLQKIRGVSFRWNGLMGNPTDTSQLGFVAQDVEQVFPELVSSDKQTGYKSLNYSGLIAPLVEAVKELKAENESLRHRIEVLEAK